MKNTNPKTTKPLAKPDAHRHRPENKDTLDSRAGEEYEIKGDDITHNKKETQHKRKNSGK